MANKDYAIFGEKFVSDQTLALPFARDGAQYPRTCKVEKNESLRELAGDRKRTLMGPATGFQNESDDEQVDWWGLNITSDGSASAGITYGGCLFSLKAQADGDSEHDGLIQFCDDPKLAGETPLGHLLERMVVPVYMTLGPSSAVGLHAGAVIDEHHRAGWMWTGPSGAGKSSIAAAIIARAPFRPCADETAVLRAEAQNGAVTMLPGAPWFRLYEPPETPHLLRDEANLAAGEDDGKPYDSGDLPDPIEKRWYRFRDELYPTESVPLQKWWLLDPDAEVEKPQSESIAGSEAATSLLNETIDFDQRDETWATRRFKNAMAVARRVPAAVVRYDKKRHEPDDIADLLLSEMKI